MDKLHNLYTRITYDTKRAEISLKINIDIQLWDSSKARMKGNSAEARKLNQYLSQISSEIFDAYD
ncbi:MAG: integrase/recombinase XerD [Saprospiraceae bacterium]|jgi:integrase/recombinase XerD